MSSYIKNKTLFPNNMQKLAYRNVNRTEKEFCIYCRIHKQVTDL